MASRHALFTGLCGLFLALSWVPGWGVLGFVAVGFGAIPALPAAWEAIRSRSIDVEFLMVFAAGGAVAVGRPGDAAGLLFLFALSGTLEKLAMAKTRAAIEGLVKLRPATALRVLADGSSEDVPVESLQIGDQVRVPAFASLPVDGQILEGRSQVNASAMTGESVPVSVAEGDHVLAGTQNLEGTILIAVKSRVGDSTLDKIVNLVAEAQENKASGERISAWFGQRYTFFVVGAFLVSLVVRLVWHTASWSHALYDSLTLLVALSPCALVISTPATTLSALAWAARNGILIRGGEYIERCGEVRQLTLDKTGTLTTGKLQVVGDPEADALEVAAALEQYSEHPIAQAILKRYGQPPVAVDGHRTEAGLGVSGMVGGIEARLGRESFLTKGLGPLPSDFQQEVEQLRGKGLTVALLRIGERFEAIPLSDTVRPETAEVLAELRSLGVTRIEMLTGDTPQTANAVSNGLGLDAIRAGLMPADKTQIVGELADQAPTMMVGDGVNDAPALARASVGVAMGGLGSDIAMQAADVVLMKDRLAALPDLIRLGRKTKRIIRANLLFAGTIIIGLTTASLMTTLPLPIAVLGHEGSTVLVILNGLRLLRGPR